MVLLESTTTKCDKVKFDTSLWKDGRAIAPCRLSKNHWRQVVRCRAHTSDARLIKIIDAMSRREARSSCLSITAKPRREARSPCLSFTAKPRRGARSPRLNTTTMPKRRARGPRPASSLWLNAKLKPAFQLQMSHASHYNYSHYWVKYCPRTEGSWPPLWRIFRGQFYPWNPYK